MEPFRPEAPPPILVAGGPGRATDIAGRHADGWLTYVPPGCDVDTYAREVNKMKRLAADAGRDPDDLIFSIAAMALVVTDEAELDELCTNPALRFSVAATVPTGETWRRWGCAHPLGDGYRYPTDYIPMEWTRDAAMRVVEQTPPSIVRRARCSGTPKAVAAQLQAYIDAGCNHLCIGNYAGLVASGDFADALDQTNLCIETVKLLAGRAD